MEKIKEKLEKIRQFFTPRNSVITLAVLLVLSIGTTLYFYAKVANDPQVVAKKDLDATISAIGRLLVLPKDEVPSLATVSDPAKLKDQPFFSNAQTGDKVLIYSLAKKAILYSPKLNKIVEVAPVNLGANAR